MQYCKRKRCLIIWDMSSAPKTECKSPNDGLLILDMRNTSRIKYTYNLNSSKYGKH